MSAPQIVAIVTALTIALTVLWYVALDWFFTVLLCLASLAALGFALVLIGMVVTGLWPWDPGFWTHGATA